MAEHHFRWIDTGESRQRGAFAWFSDDPRTETAVIFVHGFLGDAEGTWLNFQGMVDTHTADYPEWETSDLLFFPYASFRSHITDSAEELVKFLRTMFPAPPEGLFTIDRDLPLLPKPLADLDLEPRTYKQLVLVGHSQGALVIRRALVVIYKDEEPNPTSRILSSQLALFAPAIFGFAPSGMVGTVLGIGRAEKLAMLVLRFSRAFREMEKGDVPAEIQRHTEAFLKRSNLSCFTARVLFGREEEIVTKMEYTDDFPEPSEPNETHTSICKPRARYLRPFKFVFRKTGYA